MVGLEHQSYIFDNFIRLRFDKFLLSAARVKLCGHVALQIHDFDFRRVLWGERDT